MPEVPSLPNFESGVISPPVVYLPVHLDDQGEVSDLRLIELADGRVALVAYTALDRLVDGCGPAQPWALVDSSMVEPAGEGQPYDLRLLDVVLPEDLRWTGESHGHSS